MVYLVTAGVWLGAAVLAGAGFSWVLRRWGHDR